MNNKQQITVIGASGNIGAAVVKNLTYAEFFVRAIVRNTSKANLLFGSNKNIEIIEADLKDISSLKQALAGTCYLYLNLSTNTTDINIPFAAEREGIQNILNAIDKNSIKQIIQISGLGTLDNHDSNDRFQFIPNVIRKQGQKMIKESGIPYTIFHCSWFMDSFVFFQRNKVYSVIGNDDSPIYFTNCYDYTRYIIKSLGNEKAFFKEFPVQGKKGYKHSFAATEFLKVYSKEVKVKPLPLGLIKVFSLFNNEMKLLKHMADYFQASSETYLAEEFNTFSILGEPRFDLIDYANWLKSNHFYTN